jgi:AAA family ATP:ADP antiporter
MRKIFDVRRQEAGAAVLLFLFFFLVIAVFQLLKPLKNGLFIENYGAELELYAKLANILMAVAGVTVFTYLYNRMQRQRLIYAFAAFFAAAFLIVAQALNSPGAVTVWGFYLLGDFESTLMVAAFWAYLTDLVDSDQAKRLFGAIGAGGVIGGWAGSSAAKFLLADLGAAGLLYLSTAMIAAVILIVFGTERIVNASAAFKKDRRGFAKEADKERRRDAGASELTEGARLVLRSKYLLAILGVMAFYEIASQLADYQFKFSSQTISTVEQTQSFMANVYFYANLLSVVVQLFLVSWIMRRLGLVAALMVLPVALMGSSASFLLAPSLLTASLLVVSDNGLNYSLQQTARETLYTPTSPDEKYKARAFTNMFVQRFAKGVAIVGVLGLQLLDVGLRSLSLLTISVLVAMALCSIYAGRRFAELSRLEEKRPAA